MQAKVTWAGGMRFVGSGDTGHGILMESKLADTPQVASSPMEVVLMALGGCSSVDIVDIMQKMRQDLTSLEVVIKAERVKDFPRVFTKADLEFVVGGEGLTEANLQRAVALSMEKYCSVAAILRKSGCEITYSHKLAPPKVKPRAEPDRAL
jgi:putative redox protein